MGIKSKIQSGVGSGLMYLLFFLHIILLPIYLGIWTVIPSFVYLFSNWIHLVMGLYLSFRFRPFQSTVVFHDYDRILVCSAGVFILQALLATTLLNSSWGKQITAALEPWRVQFLSFLRGGFATVSGGFRSDAGGGGGYKSPSPNSANTSFGTAASYGDLSGSGTRLTYQGGGAVE